MRGAGPSSLGHTCGVAASGTMHCWGFGTWGQLGREIADTSFNPVQVSGDHVFSTTIALTYSPMCALTTGGDAYCWGCGDRGQLGVSAEALAACPDMFGNPPLCSNAPLRVRSLKFKSLAAAWDSFCAVTMDDVAYCWGGRLLGNGNTAPSFAPVKVGGQP